MADFRAKMIAYRKSRLEKLAEKTDFRYIDLTAKQENQLFLSILNMPIEYQNLLIFKNYYNHSFAEIEDITGIENAKGEYLNLVGVLSENLNIDNAIISDSSMQKVCQKAAEKINEDIRKDFEQLNDELKPVSDNRKVVKVTTTLSRKVASIAIFFLISSALLVGANAYAQGKIFKWIANTFEKYTSFHIAEENTVNKDNVTIIIGYIPEGFELKKKNLSDSTDIYYYKNKNKRLIINFLYDSINTALNTENAVQEEFELDDIKVITWEKDMKNYYVFSKEGVGCQIYGNIDKEDFIEIYNGISLKRK